MSKTKLPREWATTAPPYQVQPLHPVRVAADDEVGAGVDETAGHQALHRLGRVGVLRAPVRQHDDDVHPVGEVLDLRGDLPQVGLLQRAGPRRHPDARGRPAVSRVGRGVSPMALKPRKPKLVPSR